MRTRFERPCESILQVQLTRRIALAVLGFALDSNAGSLWVSVDGVWIGNGNPARQHRPVIDAGAGLASAELLYPVAGIPRGCGTQAHVTLHTALASLIYKPPEGFLPPASDACGCSAFFADCLDTPGCLASAERCAALARSPVSCSNREEFLTDE
jgi:hypothetical protein